MTRRRRRAPLRGRVVAAGSGAALGALAWFGAPVLLGRVAVFQPHLFSRTALHGDALGRALAAADVVVVAPIYAAREQPLPGVTADIVARGAARAGAATVAVRDRAALTDHVAERVKPGDVVFTLGAGDITRVGPELLERLARPGRAA